MRTAVIIPTYNSVDMVGDAIESCRRQTVRPEIVVVDDGSTDGTSDYIRAHFGREVTFLPQENGERGAARNAGAAATSAELLVFLDADDLLRPTHVETLLGLVGEHPEASLWATGGTEVDGALRPIGPLGRTGPGAITLEGFLGGEQAVLLPFGVRAERFRELGGFVEARELMGSEDWILTARLLAGAPGVRSDRVTVVKRTHEENTMSASGGMERAMRASRALLFEVHRDELGASGRDVDALQRRAHYAMWRNLAATHYGAGAMRDARRAAREAVHGSLLGVLSDAALRRSWLRSWLGGPLTCWLRARR